MSLNVPLTGESTLQVQELASLKRGEQVSIWERSSTSDCFQSQGPVPVLGWGDSNCWSSWKLIGESIGKSCGATLAEMEKGHAKARWISDATRGSLEMGEGAGSFAQHTTNIKHCHNGPKALSTLTHSTSLVQNRSFNKLWYLGQTSAWLCLAKGEKYRDTDKST